MKFKIEMRKGVMAYILTGWNSRSVELTAYNGFMFDLKMARHPRHTVRYKRRSHMRRWTDGYMHRIDCARYLKENYEAHKGIVAYAEEQLSRAKEARGLT